MASLSFGIPIIWDPYLSYGSFWDSYERKDSYERLGHIPRIPTKIGVPKGQNRLPVDAT